MNGWVTLAIVAAVVVLGAVAQRRGWIDLSNKVRRGGGVGGALGVVDEIFAPTRHEAEVVLDRQSVLPAPAPLAGDGDKGIAEIENSEARFDGRIRIDL